MDEDRDSLGRFKPGNTAGRDAGVPAVTEFVRHTGTLGVGEAGAPGGEAAGGVQLQSAPGNAGTGAALTPANPAEFEGLSPFFKGVAYLVRRGTTVYPDEPQPVPRPDGNVRVAFSKLKPEEQTIIEALVVMLKAQGWGYRQIVKATGLGKTTVETILRAARARDGLKDVLADLDMDILPMAIDNIRNSVRKGDVDLSVKIAQGRGALVTHQKSSMTSANLTRFEVVYKNVPGEEGLTELPLHGTVVGKPIEG